MVEDAIAIRAASALRDYVATPPKVAVVLGSGLGDLAKSVEDQLVVPTDEIDGFPSSTVSGHSGRLVFGRLEGVPLVVVQGRAHLYEGYSAVRITFPIRLLHALGTRRLVLTNAAGGINPTIRPGTLMFITDHINFAGARFTCPEGRRTEASALSERCRPASGPYGKEWTDRAEEVARRQGIGTRRGTYLWTCGPSYETKSEIAAFHRLGADAVGMSTVPEALQAAALGMDVLGISTITNPAAGLAAGPLSHDDVLRFGQFVRADLERLIRGVLRAL